MVTPRVTYAIGDIHGCSELLNILLEKIHEDAHERGNDYRLIFLGDIIDRGPDSRGAMELVYQALREAPENRLLLGNHDEFLLRILACTNESEAVLSHWHKNVGGEQTIMSYGLLGNQHPVLLAEEFENHHCHHVQMLKSADNMIIENDYVFVHAGIRPNVPLIEQKEKDLRWIRQEFLDHTEHHEKIVVHGHTITDNFHPEIRNNRIAIDTGAYRSGVLTAVAIEKECPRFLMAHQ